MADKYIIKKIEELHKENELLKKRLYELIKTSENKKSVDVNYITDTLTVWESVIKLYGTERVPISILQEHNGILIAVYWL